MTRGSRMAALAAIAVTLAGISGSGWLMAEALTDDIETSRARLEILDAQGARARSQSEATVAGIDSRLLLPPATEGTAAASLQSRVMAIASRSAVRVTSVGAHAGDGTNGDQRKDGLVVDLSAVASAESLRSFLHLVETGAPLMIVERLSVSARQGRDPSAADAPSMRDLDVEVRITAAVAPTKEGS